MITIHSNVNQVYLYKIRKNAQFSVPPSSERKITASYNPIILASYHSSANEAQKPDAKDFASIMDGQVPGGKLLGRMCNGVDEHKPGTDITFSASKSVSSPRSLTHPFRRI